MRHQQPAIAKVSRLASAIALVLSGAAVATSAYAQQQGQQQGQQPAAADEGPDRSLEEITVTGSRIRRDDFSSAQPTTVMDNEYLKNLGIINLGQAMVSVPQNVNRNSPDANAGNNFFNGSTLANLRGLNPFFGTRTLTLVDSRRHVPTNQGDGVDLNFIPTILIDRLETVTGGASASYGSGAIGGVQNILLDRDYEGIKAEIDFGSSGEGDGDSTHYGFAFGTKPLLDEHFFGFLNGHAFSVHADGGQEANISQKRFLELPDVQLGIVGTKAGVIHHFFGVVGPALGKRIADKHLAELRL